jgi:hypothetical protein
MRKAVVSKLNRKRLKYKVPSIPPILLFTSFHSGIFLILFGPEDGGDIFLGNMSSFSTNYAALYPRS